MRLKWLSKARSDLISIHGYIHSYNPAAAERISKEITRAALRLKAFPRLGRPSDQVDVRLMQVPRLPYLLPYRVSGGTIEIIAVFDERRERPEEWS